MKQLVIIKVFQNAKGQERYQIEDALGVVLHNAGGSGFKSIDTAEKFADSHAWIVISKPETSFPEMTSLF